MIKVGSPYFGEVNEVFDFSFTTPSYSSWQVLGGYDGYLYAVYFAASSTPKTVDIRVRKVKISDTSFQEEEEQKFSIENIMPKPSRASNEGKLNRYSAISKGYLYIVRYDNKALYKINLSNVADVDEIKFEDREILYIIPRYNGGLLVQFKWGTANSSGNIVSAYGFGTVYPDNQYLCSEESLSTSERDCCSYIGIEEENLYMSSFYYNGSYYPVYGIVTNYLGTICNLSSPVVKTSEQSMKITYTLTDV